MSEEDLEPRLDSKVLLRWRWVPFTMSFLLPSTIHPAGFQDSDFPSLLHMAMGEAQSDDQQSSGLLAPTCVLCLGKTLQAQSPMHVLEPEMPGASSASAKPQPRNTRALEASAYNRGRLHT